MKLFEPLNLGAITLKNRIGMAPMCMYRADQDGNANEFHFAHYGARAIGGVGLIVVEATAVEPRGRISEHDLGIWDDNHIFPHKVIAETVHNLGAHCALQIAHAGRKSAIQGSKPIAPSAIAFNETSPTPHELTLMEIDEVRNAFVSAAMRAIEAGYDMVEIHAAHGYLLHEFISPIANKRNDNYGGSFENRCRLLCEIVERIKQNTEALIIVRISASDWHDEGIGINDSVALSKKLKALGVALVHVSSGGIISVNFGGELKPLYQVGFADKIKKEAGIMTGAVGLINSCEHAEFVLEQESADMVFLGRELLRNPNFAHACAAKAKITECIEPAYARAF